MRRIRNRKAAFLNGMQDGIPIALGYFAVSFSLGIAARNVGLSPAQGFLASALCNASAGEYALFTLIGANAAYWEVALVTLITNARYFLMSCALSQRFSPSTPFFHRLLIGNYITDEFFGIAVAREGDLKPAYYYGAVAVASPCWAVGTALGIRLGQRAERGALWDVPRHHYPAGEKGAVRRLLRAGGLCLQLGLRRDPCAGRDLGRHAHDFADGRHFGRGRAAVPDPGGGKPCIGICFTS